MTGPVVVSLPNHLVLYSCKSADTARLVHLLIPIARQSGGDMLY
jgi:hypothetical protein